MMYLITAYFDESTTKIFQKMISEISKKTGNDFMTANHIPPHMTLLQFQSKTDPDKIISAFDNFFNSEVVACVDFKKVQPEIPQVLYVTVQKNEWITKINERLFNTFSSIKETIFTGHYLPKNFYPHVSLAKRLTNLHLAGSIDILKDMEIPAAGKITKITLTEGKSPRLLSEAVLLFK